MKGKTIYHVTRVPVTIPLTSGMMPLTVELGVEQIRFSLRWHNLQQHSWRLGDALRQWGIRYYGTEWNGLVPILDERLILWRLGRSREPRIAHFLWGEYGAPKRVEPYHCRGLRVVVSVHCSARRWERVWLRPDGYANADHVVLTSESQRPCVERHVPSERVTTILHGVVTDYFAPPAVREPRAARYRLLLTGNTERDHEFAAQVAAKLPADKFEWRIRTDSGDRKHYQVGGSVTLLPRLSDADLLMEYQQADVLALPMLDSAANNVILESMACGTPVMTNCAGGVPEYVASDCNFVLSNDRNVDEWVEKLLWLERNREVAEQMRPATRAWAERFDWKIIAEQYRAMYRDVLGRG
ncbi:MAG: glycosyltransferase family 4 protein [Kiritimatiellae bacterium]|nr:glycosyltransferase family 4 protein [Kiritimatiellia bacterium]MDD4341324.1 glycosyltransferase family 4 protein [Kiritimatiellia bacterium]